MDQEVQDIEEEIEQPVEDEPTEDDLTEEPAQEEGQDGEGDTTDAESDEVVITLGDEPEAEQDDQKAAPAWVKNLREENRKLVRRQRELEQQIAKAEPAKAAPALAPRPKLSDPDIDYDEDKLAARLDTWVAQKSEFEAQERQKRAAVEEAEQKWQSRINAVTSAAKTLKVPDHDDAIGVFEDTFSVVQRGLILDAPEDPKTSAQLRYVLGRNPKVAKELAAEANPVKFTFKLARLVEKMKVQPKKSAPPPERVVRSAVAGAAAVDNTLERLRKDAEKTGDLSKVLAYKSSRKKAA